MRILVADNDSRVRSALHLLLSERTGDSAIAESADLEALVLQVRTFAPELLLLDWDLPGRAAAALLFSLGGLVAQPKVIVLSRRPEARSQALAMGAAGFVYKGDPPDELLHALDRAMAAAGRVSSQTHDEGGPRRQEGRT